MPRTPRPLTPESPSAIFFTRQRLLRNQRKWTAQDLAERLTAAGFPTSRGMIANAESGRIQIAPVDQVVAASDVFSVSLDELLTPVDCEHCQRFPPPGFTCRACGRNGAEPDPSDAGAHP